MSQIIIKSCAECPFSMRSPEGRYCELVERQYGGYSGVLVDGKPHTSCPIAGDGALVKLQDCNHHNGATG